MIFFVGVRPRGFVCFVNKKTVSSGILLVFKELSSDPSCQGYRYHVRFVSDLIPVPTECRHRRACDGREK